MIRQPPDVVFKMITFSVSGKKFSQWLEKNALNDAVAGRRLASLLGRATPLTRHTVSQYRKGDRLPRPEIMVAIFVLTRGAVSPNDFYALPEFEQAAEAAG